MLPGRLAHEPSPAGDSTARVLAGYRRTASGRGVESAASSPAGSPRARRLDAVIAGLLFMAGMRRSEVSALRWADVADAADGDGVLVTVRRGKTNQEGETRDVRFVKDGVARALRTLRTAAGPVPEDQVVPLSPQMVGLRFAAAARAAGVEAQVTAHSGRVGLASELTSRGASTTDVMLAGLEDEPAGGALLGRADRRAGGCGAVRWWGRNSKRPRGASDPGGPGVEQFANHAPRMTPTDLREANRRAQAWHAAHRGMRNRAAPPSDTGREGLIIALEKQLETTNSPHPLVGITHEDKVIVRNLGSEKVLQERCQRRPTDSLSGSQPESQDGWERTQLGRCGRRKSARRSRSEGCTAFARTEWKLRPSIRLGTWRKPESARHGN